MTDVDLLEMSILTEFPSFKIVNKSDSWLMRVVNVILKILTLGAQSTFMSGYTTTIGNTVYVSSNWISYTTSQRLIILRHERVHMRQRKKYTMPLFTLLYLFAYLPGGLAYFRMKFEKEAYEETMNAMCDLLISGPQLLQTKEYKAQMVAHFTGPEYFWMWPFKKSIEAWYDVTSKKVIDNKCACTTQPLSPLS